ncbi:MAG TPA: glycosyltransferase [Burkholderiales bacterium]|nr:glycosyltransferase [Burkholderiales bacterium]
MALKVAAIYPAFAPEINEMALTWQRLAQAGRVACRVVAGADDRLKAAHSPLGVERRGNLEILRVPGVLAPGTLGEEAVAWAAEFRPDVVFCTLPLNLVNARRIARRARAPILLHAEAWLDSAMMARRYYLWIPALRPWVARALRFWHRRQARAVAFSNPREIAALGSIAGMHYLPWPHPRWSAAPPVKREARALDTVVYVGSLQRWKGAERLGEYGARLLADDPGSKLVIVGPVGDSVAERALERLKPWSREGRLRHIEHLPRAEAVALIGRSLAVFYPHPSGGWGLIGDAWRCGTPVISVEAHYDIREGVNALVAASAREFVSAVRRLRGEAGLWSTLVAEGERSAAAHDVEVVAGELLTFLELAQPQR